MPIFEKVREHALIQSTAAVLGWDEETYLPADAAEYRAGQVSWLAGRAHALATSAEWENDLATAEAADAGADAVLTANLRELRREYQRANRLSVALVARESAACSMSKHAWVAAREKSDFATFAPHLETLLEIAREKADLWGYLNEPYDALLDGYERNTSTASVAKLLESIKPELSEIAASAVEKSAAVKVQLPAGPYPLAAQKSFNSQVAAAVGFDFGAGRIDTTAHPFCTTLGPRDIRLTTRYLEADFTSSLFGVLHEAGHGLYEQGLPSSDFGLPSGTAVSLGIHESQSRLWENHVGRSRAFWLHWYPVAQETFPQLRQFCLDDFLTHLWHAEFTQIRVEADEATYDLHIILRFQLERQLLNGTLKVKDIPAAWNDSFHELFGITPKDDRHGCLQDIHWAMGGLGYFSTYTLGNINAAQLFAAARENHEIAAATDQANYAPLLTWLRENVHRHGGTLDPSLLISQATGSLPAPTAYLHHLKSRYL